MKLCDFFVLVVVCVVWGFNFVVVKFLVIGVFGWVFGFEGMLLIFFVFMWFVLLYVFLVLWFWFGLIDMKIMIGVVLCMGVL